jgi:hypothetical protein
MKSYRIWLTFIPNPGSYYNYLLLSFFVTESVLRYRIGLKKGSGALTAAKYAGKFEERFV